ncbi:MAG: hypothetical protein E7345_03525 [Clostridiales bacterium]|nr:hypothetical protein [Clostridiales bacterium]
MTKKVEEFLIEKKENLQELMANISSKTNEVASKIKSTAKNATAKVAEFIEDNKSTAKKLVAGIGAAAVVTTSAMGLASCDEPIFGGEQQTEEVETTPTYSYEEYEDAFYNFFIDDKSQLSKDDFEITHFTMVYTTINDVQLRQVSLLFKTPETPDEEPYIVFLNDYPMTKEQYEAIRDSLPEGCYESDKRCFSVDLSKVDETTKIKLYKIFFDWYVQVYPDKLEDFTIEQ